MMEVVEIKNETEFWEIVDEIDIEIGPRNSGRQQEKQEIFTLINFLKVRKGNADIDYPIRINKRESPDFDIVENKYSYGLEITELTNELYQALMTYCEFHPEFTYEPSSIDYGMTMRNTDWKNLLKRVGEPLSSKGWSGNQAEDYSAKWGRDAIIKKSKKINEWKKSYEGDINILLYSNSPGWIHNYEEFAQLLKKYTEPILSEYKDAINTVSFLSSDGSIAIPDIKLGKENLLKI